MADLLYVSLLWHMHQPYYKDPVKGEYILPWTYLHAVKDYYDMPAIVDHSPGAKVVFNLVPSLLEQILDYAGGTAVDPFLQCAANSPTDMTEKEKFFILENFFSANRQQMIEPYQRYHELYCLGGGGSNVSLPDRLRSLSDQDFFDLQVWFFLAWTGEAAKRRFPEFRELIRKGKQFNEDDKKLLFDTQRALISEIIPLYRRLHEEGKVELSVTPYFHPILPLLCDTRSAQVAMPKVPLPTRQFRYPEDARSQVARGIAYFERLFGFTPKGMWPSEGAVSEEALGIISQCGISWVASDEWVLAHSLPGGLGTDREALYRPYSLHREGRELGLLFRDHTLSDLIGFTYYHWDGDRAVADFVRRLNKVRSRLRGRCVAPVILDGENAWEYYSHNGLPFLTKLYQRLADTPGLVPATISEVLERLPERRALHRVHPGSWINADYGIWIGHHEKNTGWDFLARARTAAVEKSPEVAALLSTGVDRGDEKARLVCNSLFAAEGSDWFWWYGDDHFSPHAGSFDLLFRRHLMNVYGLLDLEVPQELYEPIKKLVPAGLVREPSALITPEITGTISDSFKWLGAGLYDLTKQSTAMHATDSLLQSFYFGFDRSFFYFRIDAVQALDRMLQKEDLLCLHLIHGSEFRLELRLGCTEAELQLKSEGHWQPSGTRAQYCMVRTAEVRVPLGPLQLSPGEKLFSYLTLTRSGKMLGRWPIDTPLLLRYAGPDLEMEAWLI